MTVAYVVFTERDGAKRVARAKSVKAIIKKHGLKPRSDGAYAFSPAMVAEAQEIDRLAGDPGLSVEALQRLESAPVLLIEESSSFSSRIKFD